MCNVDVDECHAESRAPCSTNPPVQCINTPGSFTCGPCPAGLHHFWHRTTKMKDFRFRIHLNDAFVYFLPVYITLDFRLCSRTWLVGANLVATSLQLTDKITDSQSTTDSIMRPAARHSSSTHQQSYTVINSAWPFSVDRQQRLGSKQILHTMH